MKYLGSLELFMDNTTEAFLKRINEDITKTADKDGYGTVDMWVLFQCLALDIIGETACKQEKLTVKQCMLICHTLSIVGQSFDMLENSDHFVPKTITGSMKSAHYVSQFDLLKEINAGQKKKKDHTLFMLLFIYIVHDRPSDRPSSGEGALPPQKY